MSTYEELKQLVAEVIDPWAWSDPENPDYRARILYSRMRADKALHIMWEATDHPMLKAPEVKK